MKVKELIKELEKMPQDLDVVLQTCGMDNEGWMPMTLSGWCNWSIDIKDYDGLIDSTVYIYAEEADEDDYEDNCFNCRHCWHNEESNQYYCNRAYTEIHEPEESCCDYYETDDY